MQGETIYDIIVQLVQIEIVPWIMEELSMNVTSKIIETNKVELTMTLTAEEFAAGLDTAFEKVRKDVAVEGFRKGKIPRKMFEQKFGVESLYNDALDAVLPTLYGEALTKENIEPIDFPEWDIKEISATEGVVATATVWVRPTVELGDYLGLEVTQLSSDVTDEEVQAEIDKLAATQSEMVIKEGPAVDGDTAVIDYEGFKDDVAFDGGKGENHALELGSNSFIPGFEEQVVGMSAGEEKDINVTFPEEYHAPDLAGAAVVFKIKLHEVKVRQLPEIDDEFVKDLEREGIETVEALRADITEKLAASKKQAAENHVVNSIVEQAVANATFEVPEVMVENEVKTMINRMGQQYQQQGITLDMFLQFTGQTMESLEEQMRPQAAINVNQQLVVSAIIDTLNVDVTEADVEEEVANLAQMHNLTVEQVKEMIPDVEMLRSDVKSRKTIDALVESAKLV